MVGGAVMHRPTFVLITHLLYHTTETSCLLAATAVDKRYNRYSTPQSPKGASWALPPHPLSISLAPSNTKATPVSQPRYSTSMWRYGYLKLQRAYLHRYRYIQDSTGLCVCVYLSV